MHPVTPPRSRRSANNSSQSRGLYTPKTPFGKKNERLQQSPEFLNKQSSSISVISPTITPRHNRSSKKLGEAILISSSSINSRSLFPPTPSTVGSGRTKVINNVLPLGHHSRLSPIKNNNGSVSPLHERTPGQTKRRLIFDDAELEDDDDLEAIENVSEDLLKTPSKNIIHEDLINEWNAEKFEADEDDEIIIKKGKLVNPFITKDNEFQKQDFVLKKNNDNHNPNELILINKKGERIIQPLDSNYKPKRLFE